jgi:hypothetical protein
MDPWLGVAQGGANLVDFVLWAITMLLPPLCMYAMVIIVLWRMQ